MNSLVAVGPKGSVMLDPAYMFGQPMEQTVVVGQEKRKKSFKNTDHFGGEAGLTATNRVKPIGVPARLSLYRKLAKADPLVRQLSDAVDQGQVMSNIPQVGRLFSAVGAALEIATQGRASPQVALRDAAAAMQEQ